MAKTSRLDLLKKNTETEGLDTFNIKTMLNDNWDKIDENVALVDANGKVINKDGTPAGEVTEVEFATHKAEDAIHLAGGTANAITVTTGGNYSYGQFKQLKIKAISNNTGNVTINVDGEGAVPALKFDGTQLAAGAIKAGKIYDWYYDTASGGRFFLIAKASGNAVATDVLAGKIFSNDDGEQVGVGDPDLIPSNIKKDVNIFGVNGNLITPTFDLDQLNSYLPFIDQQSDYFRTRVISPTGDYMVISATTWVSPFTITITKKNVNGSTLSTKSFNPSNAYRHYIIGIDEVGFTCVLLVSNNMRIIKYDFNGTVLFDRSTSITNSPMSVPNVKHYNEQYRFVVGGTSFSPYNIYVYNEAGSQLLSVSMSSSADSPTGSLNAIPLANNTYLMVGGNKMILYNYRGSWRSNTIVDNETNPLSMYTRLQQLLLTLKGMII